MLNKDYASEGVCVKKEKKERKKEAENTGKVTEKTLD